MGRLRQTAVRALNYFRRRPLEDDLREQLAAHAEALEEQYVAEGMSPEQARTAAQRKLGNGTLVRELTRDERFFTALETLAGDLRLALRRLGKRPVLTTLSIGALAAGIGSASAAYTLVSAALLDPLPLVNTNDLYVLDRPERENLGFVVFTMPRTYGEFQWIEGTGAFRELAAGRSGIPLELIPAESADGIDANSFFASHDLFPTLGVGVSFGRGFTEADDRPDAPLTAILSDTLWRTRFGSDPDVLGRQIRIGGESVEVIGVAVRGFRGIEMPVATDVFLPLHTVDRFGVNPRLLGPQGVNWLWLVGRLAPERTPDEAAAYLNGLHYENDSPESREWSLVDIRTAALPQRSRAGVAQLSRLLGTTVGLLLLLGCLSVGMLLLIGSEDRRDELAMCLALGANRWRLARGISMEGLVLTLVGGLLAFPLLIPLLGGLQVFELPGDLPIGALGLSLDEEVVLAVLAVSAGALLLVTLVAATFALRVGAADALDSRPGATRRAGRRPVRSGLVVVQVAGALVLLAGTGLFVRSMSAALDLNPGFDIGRIVSANIRTDQMTPSERNLFFDAVRSRLSTHPEIEWVSVSSLAAVRAIGTDTIVDGLPIEIPATLALEYIHDNYFGTMNQPVLDGREFSAGDRESGRLVAVVSEELGRFLAVDGTAVGRSIRDRNADYEIVGVAADFVGTVSNPEPFTLYLPDTIRWNTGFNRTLRVQAAGEVPGPAVRAIDAAVSELDPDVIVDRVRTMDEQIRDQMGPQQFGVTVLGGLGAMAVLLTGVGVYILAASISNGRRRELGIRAALGAGRRDLGSVVLGETLRLTGLGVLAGLFLSWAGSDLIRALLFGVTPLDVPTFAVISGLMLLVALLASLCPALAAMRVDPSRTLREE